MSTFRWNALLGEWVIVTPHRADRPFQESDRPCPFCPGGPETTGDWRVLTLPNKYTALTPEPLDVPLAGGMVMEAPASGDCRVIVLSPSHEEQFERMSDEQVALVIKEFARVYDEMASQPDIEYVLEFENRGRAIGVSLDHPHAQVYALPFVPPRIQRELEQFNRTWEQDHECLLCQTIENELKSRERIVTESDAFVALVPFAARLPYEVHIYPREHVASLGDLRPHWTELGRMIRDVVKRYSRVFDEVAYVMVFHTRPVHGEYPYWHFHVEMYPPWRDRSRMKYLAGIETGAWTYTNDTSPEEKACELREAIR
ncbi:MAG: galactose-1-phosphate uridylyltransferase [Candidatus Thorarchaeota archaeon]